MEHKEPTKPKKRSLAKLKWFYFDPTDGKMIPTIDEASARAAAKVLGAPIYKAHSLEEAWVLHEQQGR